MKHVHRLVVVVAATTLVAACGANTAATTSTSPSTSAPPSTTSPSPTQPIAGEPVRADVPRRTVTDITDAELADLVAGDTEFAFDLFHAVAGDVNLLMSPYSVASALTMTYAGARGTTAEEMRATLALGLPDDRLHAARNELDLEITAEPQSPPGDDREPFTIRVANSLWGQSGYPFLDEFLTVLAENYDAGMNPVDFVNAAEAARQEINAWVEDETEGRIVDLIPQGAVDELTRLVLVNAIWFKANWANPFDTANTADGAFTTLGGDTVTVPLMHGGGSMPYAAGDGYQMVSIPYAGDASMVVILPDAGRFDDVTAGFGPDELTRALAAAEGREVSLTLPRFEFRTQLGLTPVLQTLGMHTAFSDTADFSGMTTDGGLSISAVIHQAFITVDEEGTEAAAATAVVVGETAAHEPTIVTIDRPFLFLIRHDGTGEVMFVGQVADPS